MQGGKSVSTPLPSYLKLSKDDCPKSDAERAEMAKVPYSSAVGSLMYAMVASRPDIAFPVGVSAIALAKNPVFHSKSKHIEVRYHLIWDIMADKRLQLVKVHTDDNPVDALTKSLAIERFAHCIELMGVG
ncbi:hypothetical protein L7F22_059380 [Adiantum nelumboides]|nr:hypothetical protein [Adiantum nelumboides]